jgi:DNA-binding Xre family transcriptional regulator
MSELRLQRLKLKQERLQSEWKLKNELLGNLRKALGIETDADVKFKQEKQIEVQTDRLDEIERELEKIEGELVEIDRASDDNSPSSPSASSQVLATDRLESPYRFAPLYSKFYIELNSIQALCQQIIRQPSGLLRIKAARQMGKTSLLERLVSHAQGLNYRIVRIDLGQPEQGQFENLDKFLKYFCSKICKQLNLQINVDENWDDNGGSNDACTEFIEKYILVDNRPLLLCLDNLERIYKHTAIRDDFLSLLRSWYDQKNPHWSNWRMILSYVFPVEIEDKNRSPFNVGEMVELLELTQPQIQNLVNLHGIEDWDNGHVANLMELVEGHPFLIRLALYEVARGRTDLQTILTTAACTNGLYREHLERYFRYLERKPELKQIMKDVVRENRPLPIYSILLPQLNDSGLIKINGDLVEPTNQLYKSYFLKRL